MIEKGDLTRPCTVQVLEGYHRPWRRAFRKTPRHRIVFAGFINRIDYESGASRIEVEDSFTRLARTGMNP